jgi:transposase
MQEFAMAIVHQTNKKTGVTYVYESTSYWDKEKQQSRAKRVCIGKLDPKTHKIIPTKKKTTGKKALKPGPSAFQTASRSFYGATYLFDQIGGQLGITQDLKTCFPDTYKQILSIAYYLILEDTAPLSRFPRWASTHMHPHGEIISSQRSSDLFAGITEDARQRFFTLQGARRVEKEYLAYDTTSISSYSQCLSQVKYGINKDHERLPQINLALLYGQQSNLPFYYRKLAGNITDMKTVKGLLADLDVLGFSKVKLVMDRGFYSSENIDALYSQHVKFLVAAKHSLTLVKQHIDELGDTLRSWKNYHEGYDLYATSVPIKWRHTHARPYKQDKLISDRRMYMHLYYNAEKALESQRAFHLKLAALEDELKSGKRNPDHEKLYKKYFSVKHTPKRGVTVTANDEAIACAKQYHGYFVLLSNEIKDPIQALELYRNKDLVEKAFGNLKDRLSLRRTAVSSEKSLDGKLFVQFVALIYLSHVKRLMQEKNLYSSYTMQGVFDELDLVEAFAYPGHALRIGEMTKKQKLLYETLEVTPPSLQ